jgi:TolB-like protein/tetratricopeptide (TPR) repeat protein
VAVAAAAVLIVPRRQTTSEPLAQLSTILPLPRHPGTIAILSLAEDRSDEPLDGRQYGTAGVVDGLGWELSRGLAGTPGIRVTYPASVRILTEAGADVKELGRRLGVTTVLEWSVRRRDSLIGVDARLVRTSDGRELWSHVYERPIGEVGGIPEEIRRSVAGILGLGRADSAMARRRGVTNDLVAYDLFLRGMVASGKYTPAGQEEAVGLFRQAIARDSGFALAYTCLAYAEMKTWSGAPADGWRRAKPLVAKALELDSTLAFAHRMAGWYAMWQDRDWAAAERHLSRALALDSSDIWTYHQYAAFLAATGRIEEGLAIMRRATALDPISSFTASEVGLHLYFNRRYTEAIAVLERAEAADTVSSQMIPMVLGRAYLAVGRHDDAIRQFRYAGLQTSDGFEAPALLAYALGSAGRTQEARPLVSQYVERARASSARPLDLVAVHLGLGDTARALDWVEQIPGDRGSRFYLLSEPMFDPIRGSARFGRVLETLGLGAAATLADSARTERASRLDRS